MSRVVPLSDRKIKAAKPKEKVYRLSDGNGLALEIKPNGKKVWRVRYSFDKKEKMFTIGEYPLYSLQEAREKAREVKKLALEGIDPVKNRKSLESKRKIEKRKIFKNIVKEFFEYKKEVISPSHLKKQQRRADIYILPFLGEISIDDITQRDIADLLKGVKDVKTASTKNTDKRETARRIYMLLKQIYDFAIYSGYANINTIAKIDINKIVPKPQEAKLKAIVDLEEIRVLFKAIKEDYQGYEIVRLALMFLALTALRPGNVRNLKLKWVNLDREIIEFPAEAMKNKEAFRLPLTPALVEIVEEAKKLITEVSISFFRL